MFRLICAAAIYLVIMGAVLAVKPNRIYDHTNKCYRVFGTSPQGTLFPLWLITGITSIFSYALVLVVENHSNNWHQTTQTSETLPSQHPTPPPSDIPTLHRTHIPSLDTRRGHTQSNQDRYMNERPFQLDSHFMGNTKRTKESNPVTIMRRRTMAGGGGSSVQSNNRLSGSVDTRFARHTHVGRQRKSLLESRIWKRAMN